MQVTAKLLKKANPLQVNSPEFQQWFRGSKVVNSDGSPKVVYHGTTNTFDRFDMNAPGMNEEGFYGKGFYFTSSQDDVSRNYGTSEGPDLTSKIENRAERFINEDKIWDPKYEKYLPDACTSGGVVSPETGMHYDEDDLMEAARAIIKDQIGGTHQGTVYLTYIKMEKPVTISPRGGTYFEFYRYNERTDDYVELPALTKLHSVISGVSEDLWEEFSDSLDSKLSDGCSAYDLQVALRECNRVFDESEAGPGPILRAIFQAMGFDGIIQDAGSEFKNMKVNQGTTHYIVWKPTQVKSALGNSGKFNPRSPRMTAGFTFTSKLLKVAAGDSALLKALKKVYKQDELYTLLNGDFGPFDGGCLISAEAIILAMGHGTLVRLVSETQGGQTEHYGALVDGVYYDFSGGYPTGEAWAKRVAQLEHITKSLTIQEGFDPKGDIPRSPQASKGIAQLILNGMKGNN